MARTKHTKRSAPSAGLPRAVFPLAPDLRDFTARVPTRPTLPGVRSQVPSMTPPRSPMSPLPATPPHVRQLYPATKRPRKRKPPMKQLNAFIRQLRELTPDMAYNKLLKNVGTARIGLLKWFKMAAQHLLDGNIKPLHKQHEKWVERNRNVLMRLMDRTLSVPQKMEVIMKPGGRGFFGGILIRILLRWKERLENDKFKRTGMPPRRRRQQQSGGGLTLKQKKLLKEHQNTLRTIADPHTDDRTKKRLLNQRGGFIGALIASLAAPLLGGLLQKL